MTLSKLHDQAQGLLDAVIDEYASVGVALPARQFVAPGRMTVDCEQVAVTLERGTAVGPPQRGPGTLIRGQCVTILQPTWRIHVVRCVPHVGDEGKVSPDDADLNAAAFALLQDIWIMHVAVTSAIASAGDLGPCADLVPSGFGLGPLSDFGSAFLDISSTLTPVG